MQCTIIYIRKARNNPHPYSVTSNWLSNEFFSVAVFSFVMIYNHRQRGRQGQSNDSYFLTRLLLNRPKQTSTVHLPRHPSLFGRARRWKIDDRKNDRVVGEIDRQHTASFESTFLLTNEWQVTHFLKINPLSLSASPSTSLIFLSLLPPIITPCLRCVSILSIQVSSWCRLNLPRVFETAGVCPVEDKSDRQMVK